MFSEITRSSGCIVTSVTFKSYSFMFIPNMLFKTGSSCRLKFTELTSVLHSLVLVSDVLGQVRGQGGSVVTITAGIAHAFMF
jgi:hypothetical protein